MDEKVAVSKIRLQAISFNHTDIKLDIKVFDNASTRIKELLEDDIGVDYFKEMFESMDDHSLKKLADLMDEGWRFQESNIAMLTKFCVKEYHVIDDLSEFCERAKNAIKTAFFIAYTRGFYENGSYKGKQFAELVKDQQKVAEITKRLQSSMKV